jgi:transcription elongation factor Elf1
MASIEVRVAGRGNVRDGNKTIDTATKATCGLCGAETDVVVSVTADANGPFACKACLRSRLEAVTVAVYELREGSGLPWGKVSG